MAGSLLSLLFLSAPQPLVVHWCWRLRGRIDDQGLLDSLEPHPSPQRRDCSTAQPRMAPAPSTPREPLAPHDDYHGIGPHTIPSISAICSVASISHVNHPVACTPPSSSPPCGRPAPWPGPWPPMWPLRIIQHTSCLRAPSIASGSVSLAHGYRGNGVSRGRCPA